jgi:multicomponent Na+:H+ antiporter subunit F
MNATLILDYGLYTALVLLMLAMLLTAIRVLMGPTLSDRVLALDQLVAIAIGFIAVIAIKTGYELYIDIALALGLAGFLATAAFARYISAASKAAGKTGTIGRK